MIEELKIVADVLKSVSDDAILGIVAWLLFDLAKTIIPWGVGAFLGAKLIDRLPRVRKKKEET